MVCPSPSVSSTWKWFSIALIAGLVAIGGYLLPRRSQKPAAAVQIPAAPREAEQREPAAKPVAGPAASTEPMVVDLGGGRLSVGEVTFDRRSREITIPAEVNMREGPVEYVLVGRKGKVHESVFTTNANARDIHVAALLLGIKPEPDLGPENSAATVHRGEAVVIRVEWDRNGPPEKVFLNETVNLSNPTSGDVVGTLPAGAWLYNGSRIEADGVFAATRSASIISIIRDEDALVNNPGASRDNDEIHTPNAAKLPKNGHPVRIVLAIK